MPLSRFTILTLSRRVAMGCYPVRRSGVIQINPCAWRSPPNYGGGTDLIARTGAQAISAPLGQKCDRQNRVPLDDCRALVSKAPADGYTLGARRR